MGCFVVDGNVLVEVSETTISQLTSSLTKSTTSKKIHTDAIWMQLVELHKHVQQEGTEATGRKIR
jgi:hypothetical protein